LKDIKKTARLTVFFIDAVTILPDFDNGSQIVVSLAIQGYVPKRRSR
jgi:hypothetical protein